MKWAAIAFLALVIAATFHLGLDSQFQFDDHSNIVNNSEVHVKEFSLAQLKGAVFSGHSGVLMRPVSMLSFGINHYFSELTPFYYKVTNLVIHVCNAILIFLLSGLLIRHLDTQRVQSEKVVLYISFFIALMWGVSPVNLTPVLYVVQRMASLSTFFVLLGLLAYILGRDSAEAGLPKKSCIYIILSVVAGCLATLSKENGALLFVYLLLVELVVYRGRIFYPKQNWPFIAFFIVTLFLPGLLIIIYTLINPAWIMESYSSTAYLLSERLLTESRVLWSYVGWVLFPDNQSLGLFHDDMIISKGLIDPISTLPAVLGHLSAIAGVSYLWVRNRLPVIVFGFTLFYASHLMESTVIALELVHEHRNYLGSFGILLGIVGTLALEQEKLRKILCFWASASVVFLILVTVQRASTWGNGLESALIEVEHHPQSSAAHYEVGRQYASLVEYGYEEFGEAAEDAFLLAADTDKTRADSLFALVMISIRRQEPIESHLLEKLTSRLRDGPIYAGHATWLKTLVDCYKNEECQIAQDTLRQIFQSALDNPNLGSGGLNSAVILSASAEFLGNTGAYENALEMAVLSTERTKRNQVFIISLINLAIHFNDIHTAKKWIKVLEGRDYIGVYSQDIKRMRDRLKKVMQ